MSMFGHYNYKFPPVNQPRYPLRINVGFLIYQPIGTSRDFAFDLPAVSLSPDFELNTLKGTARISRTPQGLLVEAEFSGNLLQECVRCLEEYYQPLHTKFSELFAFRYKRNTESDLYLPEDGQIDLGPLARDYLLLETPIKSICRPDCKGLCTVCGENLNLTVCEHQAQGVKD
jgi:uncharacterized protein